MLLDTHHHLDFLLGTRARRGFLAGLADSGVRIVAQTLTPSGFMDLVGEDLAGLPAPLCSVGFHPWWIGDDEQVARELALFSRALECTRFVGEIGLDLSPRRRTQVPEARQVFVLGELLRRVGEAAGRWAEPWVLSIHAVRSVSAVLDLLAHLRVDTRIVVPVFHRFSGTSDELTRAVRMGGYLSVGPALLATKRGRAYARQVPVDRLLLETDLPAAPIAEESDPQAVACGQAEAVVASLTSTLAMLSELRSDDVTEHITRTQRRLYGIG